MEITSYEHINAVFFWLHLSNSFVQPFCFIEMDNQNSCLTCDWMNIRLLAKQYHFNDWILDAIHRRHSIQLIQKHFWTMNLFFIFLLLVFTEAKRLCFFTREFIIVYVIWYMITLLHWHEHDNLWFNSYGLVWMRIEVGFRSHSFFWSLLSICKELIKIGCVLELVDFSTV